MRAITGHVRRQERLHRRSPSTRAAALRRLALAGVVGCLAGCGGSSKHRTTPTNTASYKTLLDAGMHLLRQGNTQAAQQLFQQAIARNPQDPVAHYDLGVIYQRAGDRRDAMRQYNLALQRNSRYVPALFNKAILFSDHNAPLAIFYYREVIQMQPKSPTAFLNLGLLESRVRATRPLAVKDLSKAVRLDPSLLARIPAQLRAELSAGSGHHSKSGSTAAHG